jgi:hypothetical protein
VGAELVTENVTLVEGWASKTTVNESSVPASVGAATTFDTVTPADWAIATRECELSSVKRAVKRMANFLAEACHEVPVLAILDNQPSGSSNTQRGMEVRILSVVVMSAGGSVVVVVVVVVAVSGSRHEEATLGASP